MPKRDLRLSVPNLFIDWIEAKGRKQMLLPCFHIAKTIKGEERSKKQTVSDYLTILAQSEECGTFDRYLWAFVDGRPIVNAPRSLEELPAETTLSGALSKDLIKRGFRFVGPKFYYAFMQSVGLVNEHIVGCFRRSLDESRKSL